MNARELGVQAAAFVDGFAVGATSGVRGARDGVKDFFEAFRTELAARRASRGVLDQPVAVTNPDLT